MTCVGLIVLGLCLRVAQAQVQTENPLPPDEVEDQGSIAVRGTPFDGYSIFTASTATKTETALLEIPQAIQVVPEQVIRDLQAVRISEVLENVAGLQSSGADRTGMVDLFSVRGFQLNPGTNFYQNGRPSVFSVPPPTEGLERVEFLKGPASVLYGQAEPGGIVNMVLKSPRPRRHLGLDLQLGSYERSRMHLDGGGPLGKSAGLRINLSQTQENSFRDFGEKAQSVGIATLNWNPSSRVSLSLSTSGQTREQAADSGLSAGLHHDGVGSVGQSVVDIPISRSLNEPWARIHTVAWNLGYDAKWTPSSTWTVRHSANLQRQENRELRADPLSLAPEIVSQGIERGDLTRILRDRSAHSRARYVDVNVLGELQTSFAEHRVLIGVDYFDSVLGADESQPIITRPQDFNVFAPEYMDEPPAQLGQNPFRLGRMTLRQGAVFVQDQVKLAPTISQALGGDIHVLVGGRFDVFYDELEQSRFDTSSFTTVNQTHHKPTFRMGGLHQPNRNISLFASYSEAFRPNVDPFANEQLPPQNSFQYEAGLKWSVLEGFAFASATIFQLTKTNVVIVDPVRQTLSVAGERQARGIEVDLMGEVWPGLNIVCNYAYLHARISKGDPRGLGQETQGNIPPSSPTHSVKVWGAYALPWQWSRGVKVGGGFFSRSQVQGDGYNSIQHKGFIRFDAMAGWSLRYYDRPVRIQFNVKNIFNEPYVNGTSRTFIQPGQPLTALLQLNTQL